MTRAPLKDLRQAQRSLRASITSLRQALHRAEQAALDEPHAFVRPRWGIWCLRCGGTADRQELHLAEVAACV